MSGTPLYPEIAEPSCLYLEEQQKHERGKNMCQHAGQRTADSANQGRKHVTYLAFSSTT